MEWQLRKALELEPALHPRYEPDSPSSAQPKSTAGNEDWRIVKVLDVAIGRRPTRISGTDGKPTGPRIETDSQSEYTTSPDLLSYQLGRVETDGIFPSDHCSLLFFLRRFGLLRLLFSCIL